jgi:hypothetical protein
VGANTRELIRAIRLEIARLRQLLLTLLRH